MRILISFEFFISKIQKKEITSALEEKLMQKREEKTLKKKLKIGATHLASKISQGVSSLSSQLKLNVKKTHEQFQRCVLTHWQVYQFVSSSKVLESPS